MPLRGACCVPGSFNTKAHMHSLPIERAVEALVVALLLPALAFSVALLSPLAGVWVAGVALIHAILLALPAFLVLRRLGWVNMATSTVTGLIIGALPAAVVFAGIPGQFIPFACFGAASGFLFGAWLWLRARLSSNLSFKRMPGGTA